MSVDLVLWAADKATIAKWGQTNPPGHPLRERVVDVPAVEDIDGNVTTPATYRWQTRKGLEYSWWNGGGSLMLEPYQFRTTQTVDVVRAPRFGFTVPSVPVWADNSVAVMGGETIGTYDRTQGNTVVFMATGALPAVGDSVDIYTNAKFAPGVVLLLRIYGDFFKGDAINEGGGVEPWERSKVAKYITTKGAPGRVAGLDYYEMDGVRIFRYSDVTDWCAARGVPGHVFL